ncbi:SDR family NAD(P)-dependent oxidoreductase [Luteolibacter flavescens]|uniref:SDR family NAD(P)-dependent oxidoreductase n=1 Tax=Luteolibacter flavescens TaxID=1859460 RepID=A0ABT3FL67_9BACT|nr:SDR family NAD(P)-dependent oxidoreductase [Luteolibacter flavescens]MCW1883924.1 SDR family NAD(P)-dependent oxidoreductase [Luteolibacter flavescens]
MTLSPPTLHGVGGLVVITGGEGGLGRSLHAAFSAAGHEVLSPGRRELDVTDPEAVRDFFRSHQPELLVCNAGITRDAPLARLDEAAWDEVLAVNLRGAARCAAAASRSMVRARRGHIVFISSYSALHPPAGQAAYAAAKAGLIGLGKSLARELGPAGVRANVILPGFLETRMTATLSAERREQVRRDHVLGDFNTPDAVSSFLVHLHRHLPHTSGQVFQLDSRIG